MNSRTQQGYLLLADISGYTSFLTEAELDHAREIIADLLEVITARLRSLVTIAKLEGDAVFTYRAVFFPRFAILKPFARPILRMLY
ncbi:MAG: hypothetical protein HY563_04115, partial [Ignavibacteriales bacterium]|nr:hypothetical protein [Ignavibacteriales bacterium]